jgi:hypothetical protein
MIYSDFCSFFFLRKRPLDDIADGDDWTMRGREFREIETVSGGPRAFAGARVGRR